MVKKKIELRGCHLEESKKFYDQFTLCIGRIYEIFTGEKPDFLRGLVPLSGDINNG